MREDAGRVLACVGDCRISRQGGLAHVGYRSLIKEGDEIITNKDSYLWAYLFEGTLLRLSPNTSVSFREINIGTKENFLHARVDFGNVLWLSRHPQEFIEQKYKESDPIFLPLKLEQANFKAKKSAIDEKNLFATIAKNNLSADKYSRLNQLIVKNNRDIFRKPTYSLIVFHNGTVGGKNLSAEFLVFVGDKSYLKIRSFKQLKLKAASSSEASVAHFYFRGLENKREEELTTGQWYQVGVRGRAIDEYQGKALAVGEFLTSNIPTILTARELMAQKYSPFAHLTVDSKKLALQFGYRQWSPQEQQKRLEYIREYTRRGETINLLAAQRLRRQRMKREIADTKKKSYFFDFYSKAIDSWRFSLEKN